ncbi:MAG: V-type ATPase 116kDa subunit family protein [Waddliaceae bacterium]
MSIVSLKKITMYGCVSEKALMLEQLQMMGCLHIIPLSPPKDILEKGKLSSRSREALMYLQSCPQQLKQIKDDTDFNPMAIERQLLQNKKRMEELQDEKDRVQHDKQKLEPWGNFVLPAPAEIGNLRFWFYVIPHGEMKKINTKELCILQVNKDNRFCYVVVISEQEPPSMTGKLVCLCRESLEQLETRLDDLEFEMEDLQAERLRLTRWLYLFEENFYQLEDRTVLQDAAKKTYDREAVFALKGWIPASEVERIREYAKQHQVAVTIQEPSPTDMPPTLLCNKPLLRGGEDLLSFYMTPSYRLWDPSAIVFFSFALFFAMIFSDAGYGILFGAILLYFWKSLGTSVAKQRFRIVLLTLTLFSAFWGILVGSYFGIEPHAQSILGYFKIINMNNYDAMMGLSILIGTAHITLANLAQGWSKRKSLTAIASFGWAVTAVGGFLVFSNHQYMEGFKLLSVGGYFLIGLGLLAVVLFTSIEGPVWNRLLRGIIGLTRISGMFGDVLSYLRLFALGLASASLAKVFNDLARQVYLALPGFNVAIALLIILMGHGMNFALSVMSGFIHGLRLNYIEFFNWGLPKEGSPFKAFSKRR